MAPRQCDVDGMEIDLSELIAVIETGAAEPLERIASAAALKAHLEEIGDDLLDHFVKQAREGGASWTQIGEAMGVTRQAAQQRQGFLDRLLERLNDGKLARFTPRARTAVAEARTAARARNHPEVRTEHLLVAMYADEGAISAVVLRRLGLDRDTVEREVAERLPAGPTPVGGRVRFSDGGRKVLERALAVALHLNHNYIGTEHLLLALREIDGGAAEILEAHGITAAKLEPAVIVRLTEVISGKGA
jgi:Clp amino terminal domain, pathogenicity island component